MIQIRDYPGDSPESFSAGCRRTGMAARRLVRARAARAGSTGRCRLRHIERLYDGLLPGATTVGRPFTAMSSTPIAANDASFIRPEHHGAGAADRFRRRAIWLTEPGCRRISRIVKAQFHAPITPRWRPRWRGARPPSRRGDPMTATRSVAISVPVPRTLPDFNVGTNRHHLRPGADRAAVYDLCMASGRTDMC